MQAASRDAPLVRAAVYFTPIVSLNQLAVSRSLPREPKPLADSRNQSHYRAEITRRTPPRYPESGRFGAKRARVPSRRFVDEFAPTLERLELARTVEARAAVSAV